MHQLLPHLLTVIADQVRPLHSVALLASLPFCQAPSSMLHDQAGAQTLEIRGNKCSKYQGQRLIPYEGPLWEGGYANQGRWWHDD